MKTLAFALMVAAGALVGQAETTIYVAHNSANPVSPYGDLTTAAKTISDAMVVAAEAQDAVVIIVQPGPYAETGFTLDKAITVRGATGDPKDVTITDSVSGKRAFTITHADARIEALTIAGAGMQGESTNHGSHLLLSAGFVKKCIIENGSARHTNNARYTSGGNVYMTGGTIEDSVIQNGSVYRQGKGGNVYMTSGTLRRCKILNGDAYSNASTAGYESIGGGVYAEGGLIDSCILSGNKASRFGLCGGMWLGGTATAANCTVVGSAVDGSSTKSASYLSYGFGVHIASKTAKAINTVMYDNGGDAQKEYGTANLGNYVNCASSIDNESDAGWQTITADDFTDYAHGDYMPQTAKLIDKGTTDPAHYPSGASTTDLAGNPRISGKSIDIGCYEADGSKASCSGTLSSYATFEENEVICHAEASGGVGDAPTFKWDFGNGEVRTTDQADYSYAYPTSGLFTVSVMASGDGGTTWVATNVLPTKIVVIPETMYVNSTNTTPVFPFKTPESAATTLTAVMSAMTNNNSVGLACCVSGAVVRIMKSDTALTDRGIVLDNAIIIRGDTGNPEDVVITHSGGAERAFALQHPGAVIEGLTIGGSGTQSKDGGHISVAEGIVRKCIVENGVGVNSGSAGFRGCNIYLSGGIVEDSVIRGGHGKRKQFGANVAMSGGCVRRCHILNGIAASQANLTSGGYESIGGGVYMTGGVLENCLVASNVVGRFSYTAGIYLNGAGTVVNCTVVGGTVTSTEQSGSFANVGVGIHIANSKGRVINTVVYDNGGTAQTEFGTGSNLACYDYCASSVANESAAHWTTITAADFSDYAAWTGKGAVEGLRPSRRSGEDRLINAGTKWDEYLGIGATSTTDLCGGERLLGRRVDIGCLENLKLGLMLFVR